mmetsp:Transcript_29963/g.56535  ORF Transcript_29963/g.56535 Transcript_29963/m.56535 type:complete len:248 (+) Transcript_29963:51-794(+)
MAGVYQLLQPLGTLTGIWTPLSDTPAQKKFWMCASTVHSHVMIESSTSKHPTSMFVRWQSPAAMEMGTRLYTGTLNGLLFPIIQRICLQGLNMQKATEGLRGILFLASMDLGKFLVGARSVMTMKLVKRLPGIRSGFDWKARRELPLHHRRPLQYHRARRRRHLPPPPLLHPRLLPAPQLPHQPLPLRLPQLSCPLHVKSTCTWDTPRLECTRSALRLVQVCRTGVCTVTWRRTEEGGCCSTPTTEM